MDTLNSISIAFFEYRWLVMLVLGCLGILGILDLLRDSVAKMEREDVD